MYGFILNMWVMKKINEVKVYTYVPKFITHEEADVIISTPQLDNYENQSVNQD